MPQLTLESFLASGSDPEANQYRILQGLHGYQAEFSRNRLFPALSELIDLVNILQGLLQEKTSLEEHLPQHLSKIDLEHKKLFFEPLELSGLDFQRIIELAQWALPLIKSAIDEGMKIYDFVDENLSVEEVGILPVYRDEGYCFVPEHRVALLHLLRYEASLYTSGDERYRTLKTKIMRSIPQSGIQTSPESIKLELIEERADLPNPATFVCETDLEFPFAETMLPVAKRKLMARVFS